MDKIIKFIEDELEGCEEYYDLYLEYKEGEIGENLFDLAEDEFEHFLFWYELGSMAGLDLSKYEEELKELKEIFGEEENE